MNDQETNHGWLLTYRTPPDSAGITHHQHFDHVRQVSVDRIYSILKSGQTAHHFEIQPVDPTTNALVELVRKPEERDELEQQTVEDIDHIDELRRRIEIVQTRTNRTEEFDNRIQALEDWRKS